MRVFPGQSEPTIIKPPLDSKIEAVRFRGFADYDLRCCDGAEGAKPDHSSSLASGDGELVVEGERRSFLVAVVAADHRSPQDRPDPKEPPWSTFLVIEMESAR